MAEVQAPEPAAGKAGWGRTGRRLFWPGGLSARLLVLTALFVALAGAFILPPALAAFERNWLLDRVRAAELASLATEVAPDRVVSEKLSAQLLAGAGVETVAIQSRGLRRLVLQGPRRDEAPYLVDLREQAVSSWLLAPFQTLSAGDDRAVRVIAEPRFREEAEFIEVVAPHAPLKGELKAYLWQLVFTTLFVAGLAGALVFLSLNFFLVRPMQRITRAMERFRADPDDPLDRMQADLRIALASRARLAALGEAVAKINHDLRNMLTSAQMASERLASVPDPRVAQALPRLERALDRAVRLASDVLAYGKTQEAPPAPVPVNLAEALADAAEEGRLTDQPEGVLFVCEVAPGVLVQADPDQLHRILVNLMRNAREAIEAVVPRRSGVVRAGWRREGEIDVITLADNGPGLSERARERLFQPFAGSGRPDGAGLGLAIARELVQGHGGDLFMAATGPAGSVFEIHLPAAARGPRRSRPEA
ncbi:MAG: HAMP domain-containing histidine kinase [Phenylobacterium sp.]|nr:HAMP domain-containing histidine kinase [Phenylobacterium sp.]